MTPPPSTEGLIERVEATIHRINGHWWNRRKRPEAPDIRALIDLASRVPEGPPDDVLVDLLAINELIQEHAPLNHEVRHAFRRIEALARFTQPKGGADGDV